MVRHVIKIYDIRSTVLPAERHYDFVVLDRYEPSVTRLVKDGSERSNTVISDYIVNIVLLYIVYKQYMVDLPYKLVNTAAFRVLPWPIGTGCSAA